MPVPRGMKNENMPFAIRRYVHLRLLTLTQVGGAGVDVSELLGEEEILAGLGLDGVTDSLDAAGKPLKDSLDVTALLHGDDPELILLIDPDKEGLVGIVEDSSALGPVALHAGNLQVGISRHEEEVVINELLPDLLIHAGEGVVAAGEVTLEALEGLGGELLNTDTLLLGDSGGETESLDGTSHTDAGMKSEESTLTLFWFIPSREALLTRLKDASLLSLMDPFKALEPGIISSLQ